MNPSSVPADPMPAMAHSGTFVRPGALVWGRPDDAALAGDSVAVEEALTLAVKDPDRLTDLLDALRHARLWLPLPDDGPVTDGSAVRLPTVTYLGAEFIPAFTSAERLTVWPMSSLVAREASGQAGGGQVTAIPHIVVPAAELARLLPPRMGIALNPGAEASVPIFSEGISHLAGTSTGEVRIGHPPADPVNLLAEVRAVLRAVPAVRSASRAWLSVPGRGEGLVISVSLRDPADQLAQHAVIDAIERAVAAAPQPFPIDVTFPGEDVPDQVDEWVARYAEPFYARGSDVEA